MSPRRVVRVAFREVRALLDAPGGSLMIGAFWLIAGILLFDNLSQFQEGSRRLAESGQVRTGPVGLHVNDAVVQPLLLNLGSILTFFVPLLTMRSFAEERRTGSLELLLSQPLSGAEVLLGKYLGALFSLGLCLSILSIHAVVLRIVSLPDWTATLTGFLGLLLLAAFFAAVGVLVSVLTRSQVEAGVIGLGALLALAIGPVAFHPTGPWTQACVSFVSVMTRFADFSRGILDLGHVAFFLGATFLMLAAAVRCLDLLRWQG